MRRVITPPPWEAGPLPPSPPYPDFSDSWLIFIFTNGWGEGGTATCVFLKKSDWSRTLTQTFQSEVQQGDHQATVLTKRADNKKPQRTKQMPKSGMQTSLDTKNITLYLRGAIGSKDGGNWMACWTSLCVKIWSFTPYLNGEKKKRKKEKLLTSGIMMDLLLWRIWPIHGNSWGTTGLMP